MLNCKEKENELLGNKIEWRTEHKNEGWKRKRKNKTLFIIDDDDL